MFQETFWKRINDFISDGYRYLEKVASQSAKGKNEKINSENERRKRIDQLKAEGQKEAALLYEKYQRRKIEELNFIRNLLERETFDV